MDPLETGFTPTRPAGCLTRFRLERFLAGELGDDAARVEAHLEGCEACRALRAGLEAEKAAFQAAMPFEQFYGALERRLAADDDAAVSLTFSRRAAIFGLPGRLIEALLDFLRALSGPAWAGMAVAALAVAILVPRVLRDDTGIRTMGVLEPEPLEVYVLRHGQSRSEIVKSGAVLHADDRLQFLIHPGSRRYLQLFSVDATGRISSFYPDGRGSSIHLGGDGEQLLYGSIRLDTYVGLERIFAIYTDEPIDTRDLEDAVKALRRQYTGPLPLDRITRLAIPSSSQDSFLMVKE